MEITIPALLKALATAGAAAKELGTWWKAAKGNTRSLVGELKDNLTYLDLVADDGVELAAVIEKLSTTEYKRLSDAGFNFNILKKEVISQYPSLENTDLSPWRGKNTELLVQSIYEKINDLKIRFPHVKNSRKYRWYIRVHNIRKRIWLLLMHVGK